MNDPLLEVAADLREIRRLAGELETEAVYRADDKDQPGGEAMTMLGPVASIQAVTNRIDGADRWNLSDYREEHALPPRDTSHALDEYEDEPPLQLLAFWSELWRMDFDTEIDTPTLETETQWLGDNITTLHTTYRDNRWDLFTKDVHKARSILEAVLREGERATHGVRCPQCLTTDLIRVTEPRLTRPCSGHKRGWCHWPKRSCCDRGGLQEVWECPTCGNRLKLADYESVVMRDYIASAPWLPIQHIERRTNVKATTVKVWAHRGHVRTRRDEQDRTVYCIEDIETRHAKTNDAA